MRTITPKEKALLEILRCEQADLKKLSDTIYVWSGILYQIIDKDKALKQHRQGKIRLDHFMKYKNFYMREVGTRSVVYKKFKKYL